MKACRKILVALNGSENSVRAVQYVGEMLRNGDDFTVQLFCVARPPERDLFPDDASWGEALCANEEQHRCILRQGREILESRGFGADSVTEKFVCTSQASIARVIEDEMERGGFGTVVVGRRGVTKAEEFLFGSVSSHIVHYARNCAVWVVE